MVYDLSKTDSAVNDYMRALRDISVQDDREKFRLNVRRIGRVIGYEISKQLTYKSIEINTPMKAHEQRVMDEQPVVVTILRAGLPMHDGLLDVFPNAENGYISAYRKHSANGFTIEVKYVACPKLDGKTLILNDPMLATGQSFLTAWSALLEYGQPKQVMLAAVIGSEEGVMHLKNEAPGAFNLWVGAVDPTLNKEKYIVPGLGDAGDLSFGPKVQN